jgi:hypothetical protein
MFRKANDVARHSRDGLWSRMSVLDREPQSASRFRFLETTPGLSALKNITERKSRFCHTENRKGESVLHNFFGSDPALSWIWMLDIIAQKQPPSFRGDPRTTSDSSALLYYYRRPMAMPYFQGRRLEALRA